MSDCKKDEIFEALFGGLDLDTEDFVKRILSMLKSKDETELVGAITDLNDRSDDIDVDKEFIRLLQEGIENDLPENELEDIVFCLRNRSLKRMICDELEPDLARNIEIGKEFGKLAEPLAESNLYLCLIITAASYVRCGLVEGAKQIDIAVIKELEKQGRMEKAEKEKEKFKTTEDAENLKKVMDNIHKYGEGLRGYPEDRGKMMAIMNGRR
jgi:hypothetical protein